MNEKPQRPIAIAKASMLLFSSLFDLPLKSPIKNINPASK
jgi:hypothetical protein